MYALVHSLHALAPAVSICTTLCPRLVFLWHRAVRAFVSDTLFVALACICGVATMDLLRNFFWGCVNLYYSMLSFSIFLYGMLSYVRLVRAFVSDTLFVTLARICGVATMGLIGTFVAALACLFDIIYYSDRITVKRNPSGGCFDCAYGFAQHDISKIFKNIIYFSNKICLTLKPSPSGRRCHVVTDEGVGYFTNKYRIIHNFIRKSQTKQRLFFCTL